MEINLKEWVDSASEDRILFRQAIHIILYAISSDDVLRINMIMKGGMLLGIRYSSTRFTKDIDFSTSQTLTEVNKEEFEHRLADALVVSSDELPYQIECRLQSSKIQPNKKATFPSFKIKIGYANSSNRKMMARLMSGNSPSVIDIDYSLNEISNEIEELVIKGEEAIHAYAITDIISEKYRSLIQQIVRNRERRQDVYDLWYLISNLSEFSISDKKTILESLYKKAEGRIKKEKVTIDQETLDREDIVRMSEIEYSLLESEVDGYFPSFEEAYETINDFYKSLPWS